MPVVKLNARNITTLPAIGGVRTDYRDELLPGVPDPLVAIYEWMGLDQ